MNDFFEAIGGLIIIVIGMLIQIAMMCIPLLIGLALLQWLGFIHVF